MTIQDFMLEAELAAAKFFRDIDEGTVKVSRTETVKFNDIRLYGLSVSLEGENAGRFVYLDDLYERYEAGESVDSLLDEAVIRCEDSLYYEVPVEPHRLRLDLDSIRDRLTVRLLGTRNNMSYMAGRPYIDVGCGLALIAVINHERRADSEWVIAVTDELLRSEIKCSREELLTAALDNTVLMEPPVLVNLAEHLFSRYMKTPGGPMRSRNYLEERCAEPQSHRGAFMLSNTSMIFGAAALFYPGVMEKISEVLGCGYYVLPSSVHEVMIIPDDSKPDVPCMIMTVREANTSVVERTDLLSDNVFHYDPDRGLETVRENESGWVGEQADPGRYIA